MDDRGPLGSFGSPELPSDVAERLGSRPVRVDRRRADTLRNALHDRLGPRLANLHVRLELLEEASGGAPRKQIAKLRREVASLIQELSRIVHDEPPEPLERKGLVAAVRAACRAAERPGLRVDFTVAGVPQEPPTKVAELIYRAVLEGTANVARHAVASRCLVRLTFTSSHVTLEIRDNGKASLTSMGGLALGSGGLGLASLWREAHRLGGVAQLHSLPGPGAKLLVRLPLGQGPRPRFGGAPAPEKRLP